MSDKDKPEQKQSEAEKTSEDKTVIANSEPETPSVSEPSTHSGDQQGLSASIKLTTEKTKTTDKKTAGDTEVEQKKESKDTERASSPVSSKSKAKVQTSKQTTSHSSSVKKASDMTQKVIDKKPTKASVTKASEPQKPTSKTAVFALIIALLAVAASAGHYYWAEQQKSQMAQQLSGKLQEQLQKNQKDIAQQLLVQKRQYNKALANVKADIARDTTKSITYLQHQIANLTQKQPSDWLLHEAEYLIRVASRTLWLEKNTTAAMGLLRDADRRIEELNDPQFLPVRQVIQQDIARLQLLPTLNTDNVILKLMALAEQTKQLPLAMVDIPNSNEQPSDLELTENASDWRENLAKTWRKFLADFITVSRRTGDVEPLMSPEFSQNLRENLNLKIQTAIWAASKGKTEIYQQSLADIQTWLNEYFDMSVETNQKFAEALKALNGATVYVDYPNKLTSLAAIREALASSAAPIPTQLPVQAVTVEPTELPNVVPVAEPEKAEPQETETTPAQREDT